MAHTKEVENIQRLQQEQEKAIFDTQQKLQKLESYKNDYLALKSRLETLPDKVAHDVMVPFGKLAFMPGKLVHTNEILVLLGDNWFAEKSAKQACSTVDRRLQVLNEQITSLTKQKSLLEPRLSFTSEMGQLAAHKDGMIEIKEEYDPEKEKKWRAEHKKHLQAYNKQRRQEEQQARAKQQSKLESEELSDKQLWARLDELEEQEQIKGELERFVEDNSTSNSESGTSDDENNTEKTIRWKDHNMHKTINFTHTKVESHSDSTKETPELIQSPADIYKHFIKSDEPKSILKNTDKCSNNSQQEHDKVSTSESIQAFSGEVHERKTSSESATHTNELTNINVNKSTEQEQPKRISKFKAQRMTKK